MGFTVAMKRFLTARVIALGGFVFLSFILRLFGAPPTIVVPDSCLYLSFAKSILNGKFSFDFHEGIDSILPPLYSISSAVLSFVTGDIEFSGVLVSVIAGALLVIPVFYLAKAIYDERSAWLSAVLILLSPLMIRWSGVMLTESLFITLFLSGIALGWHGIEGRKNVFLLLSGACIGLSYMTRIIGLVAVPAVIISVIFYSLNFTKSAVSGTGWKGDFNLKKLFKKVMVPLMIFFAGFILVTSAYLVKLHSFYGHWTIAGSYGSIKSTITYEGSATTSGWERLDAKKTGGDVIERVSNKVINNARNYLSALFKMLVLTIIFIAAGLFPGRKAIYPFLFVIFYFLALLVQPLSPLLDERVRYISPIVPLLLITTSGGIVHIYDAIKWKAVRYAMVPVSTGIVLVSFIYQLQVFPFNFNSSWITKKAFTDPDKIVGRWMNTNLPHPLRMMTRKPYIPYFAGATWFLTPSTYNAVIELANQKGVDYIVVDRRYDYFLRPELRFLFHKELAPSDLKFIDGVNDSKTSELVIGIYKINRQ
ncbi:MAG: glycosyltransferase family 39 protein [Nitrospirae bacterium]|nr:glycosyltransferase family 39 protein [Nitrospirota bacterium]